MSESQMIIAPPANPGASATAILWDSTYGLIGTPVLATPGTYRRHWPFYKRALVTIFADQSVTFFTRSLASGSTTWRTYNNGGAGDVVAASTFFERDVLFVGEETQIYILTATNPTTWEVSIKLRPAAALAQ